MIRHRIFLAATLLLAAALAGLLIYGRQAAAARGRSEIAAKQRLVQALGLTDLSLWSEARYTRHPSQADFFAPFQEFPASLEHFPAGAIMAPPRHLRGGADHP